MKSCLYNKFKIQRTVSGDSLCHIVTGSNVMTTITTMSVITYIHTNYVLVCLHIAYHNVILVYFHLKVLVDVTIYTYLY